MMKLEIVIRPEKLDALKQVFNDHKVTGMMITNIMGYGNQKGYKQQYRGSEYNVNLLPKVKVETVVSDKKVEKLIESICGQIKTGEFGDGKIFLLPVDDAVRIRTGERGENAL